MNATTLQAHDSEIKSAVRIIWQRRWKANVESVSEMLAKNVQTVPLVASHEKINKIIASLEPEKEQWLGKKAWIIIDNEMYEHQEKDIESAYNEGDFKIVFKRTDACTLPFQKFEDNEGLMTHYFVPGVDPDNKRLYNWIEKGFKILTCYKYLRGAFKLNTHRYDMWAKEGMTYYASPTEE